MTLNFYLTTYDPRTVSKTLTGSEAVIDADANTSLSGTFRDATNTFDPVVAVEMDAAYMFNFNYVQIVEWSRYYFVRERRVLLHGLIELQLEEDTLNTWSSWLLLFTGHVSRTATNLKPFLSDSRRVLSTETTKTILTATDAGTLTLQPSQVLKTDFNVMLDVMNKDAPDYTRQLFFPPTQPYLSTQGTGMMTGGMFSSRYATNYANAKEAFKYIIEHPISGLLFGQSMEAVVNCIVYPFEIKAYSTATSATGMYMNGAALGAAVGYPLWDNPYAVLDLGKIKHSTASSFLDYEPYTKAHLYLPYAGVIDIPMRWLCGNGIHIEYVIALATGEAQVVITSVDTNRYINTLNVQIGVKVPLASANSVQQAQQYILGGLKAAASIPAMYVNPVAGGLTMASALTDLAFNPLVLKGQTPDSALARMLEYQPFVILEQVVDETPVDYGHYVGYPYDQIVTLNTLSGRCVVDELFGTFSDASEREMDDIRAKLRAGVIF